MAAVHHGGRLQQLNNGTVVVVFEPDEEAALKFCLRIAGVTVPIGPPMPSARGLSANWHSDPMSIGERRVAN